MPARPSLNGRRRLPISDGSYYYSNPNGSTYYNDGAGGAQYTPPSGGAPSQASAK